MSDTLRAYVVTFRNSEGTRDQYTLDYASRDDALEAACEWADRCAYPVTILSVTLDA